MTDQATILKRVATYLRQIQTTTSLHKAQQEATLALQLIEETRK